ncbi:Melanopsin-A [Merluccius polli]|uniref:Melanopsin-A n=1 Tax=Merluccius polli TaxID=89951 RepID=A0AA47N089_MERPO|nr:Melanopsin-A [Merluccius polli]
MYSEVGNASLLLAAAANASGGGGEEEEDLLASLGGQQRPLSRTGHAAVSVCLGTIMALGFVNNAVVLALFCRFRVLRTPVNVLLLNISVSDMLVCACGTTLSFASSLRARWLYGRRGCMWYGFVNSCFVGYKGVSHGHLFLCLDHTRIRGPHAHLRLGDLLEADLSRLVCSDKALVLL